VKLDETASHCAKSVMESIIVLMAVTKPTAVRIVGYYSTCFA